MANNTIDNGHGQRKQLSWQLDRLDTILDGLADALNESVADAVKDVVGQVVRESVETTIREVLGNPTLLQAALEKHTPQPILTPKRSLKEVLKNALTTLVSMTCQAAGKAKSAISWAWTWTLTSVRLLLEQWHGSHMPRMRQSRQEASLALSADRLVSFSCQRHARGRQEEMVPSPLSGACSRHHTA
jgi:hypothetical protein